MLLLLAGANLRRLGGNLAEAAGQNDIRLRTDGPCSPVRGQSCAVDCHGIIKCAGPLGSAYRQVRIRQEVMMLAGENGAGKSTLKNILSGLVAPDSGLLHFDGKTYKNFTTRDADRLGIGTIHQELSLFENLSVAENIFISHLPQRAGTIDRTRLRSMARELMEKQLGMLIDPSREVGALSLGERQMVEIAKALSQSSSLIIFDEPTTCLSNPERQRLFSTIRRLKAQNYAIIYITHFMEEVYTLGDRITILRDGRVVGQRTVAETPISELARLMVGREISGTSIAPPELSADAPVLLEVANLNDGAHIHDISFNLRKGEVLGLGGLLGAGRSEIAEAIFGLRPATGTIAVDGQLVAHEPIRPIHVLDTTRFTAPIKPMSRFSKKYLKRVQQWKFMKSFMEEIAKPILPTDEYLDYIPTQAVAEYLLHHHVVKHRSADARIEGIIYKSAQRSSGRNIVLLGDAASVRSPEQQQPQRKTSSLQTADIFDDLFGSFMKAEVQDPALEVIQDSVKEYRIGGADYQAAEVVSFDFDPDDEMF